MTLLEFALSKNKKSVFMALLSSTKISDTTINHISTDLNNPPTLLHLAINSGYDDIAELLIPKFSVCYLI